MSPGSPSMTLPSRLGAVLHCLTAGAYAEAEAAAWAVMADYPGNPHAALLAGLSIAAAGEAERAAPILVAVAAANSLSDHPCVELSRLQPLLPRPLVAAQFQACLLLQPDDRRLRLAYAEFLLDIDQAEAALPLLADAPDTAEAQHLKGLALAEQGAFAAALTAFGRTVALAPNAAAAWSNLGMMLKVEGRFAEAIAAHDRAVTLAPGNPRFRVNRAVAHLRAGDWPAAWPDHEFRLDLADIPGLDKQRVLPPLRPGARLDGITVAALHEDGFGDTLHFCRYLPLLAERGARVLLFVPPPLERLMRGLTGVSEVVSDASRLGAHDFICPMFSLPAIFGTTPDTIPPVPQIRLDEGMRQRWASHLPDTPELKVGLVWAGQARPSAPGFGALDRRRSAGLAACAPLFDSAGVRFVSLQKGPAAEQAAPLTLPLLDPMAAVQDFADTAAIIASLDLVISVDTSIVHLAGLLGVPVFLLDRYDNCWRWLSGRTDSPWYPQLTIFRQERPNDWTGAMARAAAALHARARAHTTAAAAKHAEFLLSA